MFFCLFFVLVVCQLVYGCFLFVFLLVGGGGRLFACSLWLLGGGGVCCLYVMETSLHDYQYGLRACFCMHA